MQLQLHSLSPAQGGARPQRFIPYGALYGNALLDDGRVAGRKDRQFTVSARFSMPRLSSARFGML